MASLAPGQTTIAAHFWWPNMGFDIAWYIRTCHLCQIWQTRNVLIPPIVATPAPLFAKIYIDTMHLPPSGSYKYIVQGRCSLTYYPEFRMLRSETAKTIGDWIYEDILCRWGSLREIVSDNGSAFLGALDYLSKRYHVNHIRISGYNSRANGLVERSHFDVRQSLFKAVDGDQKRWSLGVHSVFWAERVTIRKRMGCSPYFAVTGSHPLIPLDISEATYLQPPPHSVPTSLLNARSHSRNGRTTSTSYIRRSTQLDFKLPSNSKKNISVRFVTTPSSPANLCSCAIHKLKSLSIARCALDTSVPSSLYHETTEEPTLSPNSMEPSSTDPLQHSASYLTLHDDLYQSPTISLTFRSHDSAKWKIRTTMTSTHTTHTTKTTTEWRRRRSLLGKSPVSL